MITALKVLLAVALVGVGLPSGVGTRTGGINAGPAALTGTPASTSPRGARELYDAGPELAADALLAAKKGTGAADDVFHVTPDGVVPPKGPKHKSPEGYVENSHRSGSYGEIVNGKFKERLRINPPTPPRRKVPSTSHSHLDGKGKHYSPAPGDKAPGFQP